MRTFTSSDGDHLCTLVGPFMVHTDMVGLQTMVWDNGYRKRTGQYRLLRHPDLKADYDDPSEMGRGHERVIAKLRELYPWAR
jgi:hypothetical protein